MAGDAGTHFSVLALATHLRERLAAHASRHADEERDAVELVGLADELLSLMKRNAAPDRLPLSLVWPTDHRVYTQKFGQRPEYYAKFGLPGHEGVDLKAPAGSNVYACADGKVVMAGWHPKRGPTHPYGVQIRIRHQAAEGEYETIYAHLTAGSPKVAVDDVVQAGQAIALAGSTGNSSGPHVHLTLKKIGAKNGGYGEIIDPEPFFKRLNDLLPPQGMP